MKTKSKGILIGVISTAVILGALGAVAYLTNGFKDTNKIREYSKSGTVVETVVLSDDNNYFLVKNHKSDLDGAKLLVVDEVQEMTINGYENFENFVDDFELSSKDLDKMWEKTAVREKANAVTSTVNLHIEKDEQEDSHFVEIAYFDTLRINYAVDTNALALSRSWNEAGEKAIDYQWGYTADGTGLYQEVNIFSGKTVADSASFNLISCDGVKDFDFEIESIEFVNKNNSKARDTLYMYDCSARI